jgi:hypothetical protein
LWHVLSMNSVEQPNITKKLKPRSIQVCFYDKFHHPSLKGVVNSTSTHGSVADQEYRIIVCIY